jgi:hypothetical protein
MRIERAQMKDVPRIMDCARQFCAILNWKLNESHYGDVWARLLSGGSGAIFLLTEGEEVMGGIGGMKHADLLSGELCAVELFWYIQPKYRAGMWSVRLVKLFEKWAEQNGCHHCNMVIMEGSMPDKLDSFYQRMGYRKTESVYQKVWT